MFFFCATKEEQSYFPLSTHPRMENTTDGTTTTNSDDTQGTEKNARRAVRFSLAVTIVALLIAVALALFFDLLKLALALLILLLCVVTALLAVLWLWHDE